MPRWLDTRSKGFLWPLKTKFGAVYRNHPVCSSVCLSVQSKLNLRYNFWTKSDRAVILHMCITCCNTFLLVPKILTSWPWLLTYLWKKLTLAITFEPREIGLSDYRCVLLVPRPFYSQILTSWPWPWFLTYLWKKLYLGYTFWTKRDGVFILHMYTCVLPVERPFCLYQKIDLVTLTLTFDLLLKKLTLTIPSEPRETGLSY